MRHGFHLPITALQVVFAGWVCLLSTMVGTRAGVDRMTASTSGSVAHAVSIKCAIGNAAMQGCRPATRPGDSHNEIRSSNTAVSIAVAFELFLKSDSLS